MKMNKWEPESNPKILRRVGKTGEECSELLKVINRIVIQGYDGIDPDTAEHNSAALTKEIADVYAQLDETVENLNLDAEFIATRRAEKRSQMQEWESYFAKADPNCAYCNGTGERFWHTKDCDNEDCALAAGLYDCMGQVERCPCTT